MTETGRPKRLYRSSRDRMIYGICGGLAEYFAIDPTLVRLLMVIALFVTGGTVGIAYLVARFIVPSDLDLESPSHR